MMRAGVSFFLLLAKKRTVAFWILLTGVLLPVFGQPGVEPSLPLPLEEAIGKGDVEAMGAHLHRMVELTLPDVRGVYERPHVIQILKKFYVDHPLVTFRYTYRILRGNGYYVTGRLFTKNGYYRLILWLMQADNTLKIYQLRIEEDND